MKTKSIFLLLLLISLVSCEDVVDIQLKEGQTFVVVDAFLTNSFEKQNIRLSYSSPYFSNSQTPPIENATVRVKNENTDEIRDFTYQSNGNYSYTPVVGDDFFQIGHRYQLTVVLNGNRFISYSTLNRSTKIDTILYEKNTSSFGPKDAYIANVVARDSLGGPDYYWFRSYYNGVFLSKPGQLNLAVDGASGEGADGFFFAPNITFGINPSDGMQIGDSLEVEIYSLNKDAYEFLQQAQQEMENGGLFARTPENVSTNVVSLDGPKVIGYFNVGASSKMGITVR